MTYMPAARLGDLHTCPFHGGGPIVSGASLVLIEGLPAARVTDQCSCPAAPDMIIAGSSNVFIAELPAARVTDPAVHGGVVSKGASAVFIGSGGPGQVKIGGKGLIKIGGRGAVFIGTGSVSQVRQPAQPVGVAPQLGIAAEPTSFAEAIQRLKNARERLITEGYRPKYSDEQLEAMAANPEPLKDRYIVSLQATRTYDSPLGYMRDSGRTTTWTGAFDQLENADTDPEVISALFGMDYDPKKEHTLYIIDRQATRCAGPTYTIVPTWANLGALGKSEFKDKFTQEIIEGAFCQEYAGEYAGLIAEFDDLHRWPDGSTNIRARYILKDIREFADAKFANDPDKKNQFLARHLFNAELGANDRFLGNGLTKNTMPEGIGKYGGLEVFTLERHPYTVGALLHSVPPQQPAIAAIPCRPLRKA